MKKTTLLLTLLVMIPAWLLAQSRPGDDYSRRYTALVSRMGASGIGVETLLESWQKADPSDTRMLEAWADFYYVKSRTTEVVQKDRAKHLGKGPVITLKDSLGRPVRYFQEEFFDDSLFSLSLRCTDRLAEAMPKDLYPRFKKAANLIAYEKDSPALAVDEVLGIVDRWYASPEGWTYNSEPVGEDFIAASALEYCLAFYNIGTEDSYDAFYRLSSHMSHRRPSDVLFIRNVGTYHLVAKKDFKTAKKYYDKALKLSPGDPDTVHNCIVMARQMGNAKLERKYASMIAEK